MWFCIIPFRLARARESDTACGHPVQLTGIEGLATPRSFSSTRDRRTCISVSSAVHGARVSDQDYLHGSLANDIPLGVQ